MNTRRRGCAAALMLGLTTPWTATAGGLFDGLGGLFGLLRSSHRGQPASPRALPPMPSVLGHPDLGDSEFPAFGGFRVEVGEGQALPAMAGMVFRTHRHLLARATQDPGLLAGTPLQVSRGLGTYTEGHEAAMLQGVMLRDSLRAAPAVEAPRIEDLRGEGDLVDTFQRRLETHTGKNGAPSSGVRELGFELRSVMGERRRHVLLYRAERRVQEDGQFWWVADMYDPHMAAENPARRSRLRLQFGRGGRLVVQVSQAWADAVEAEPETAGSDDPFTHTPNVARGWAHLETKKLGLVDDVARDLWAPEYIRVDGSDRIPADQRFHDLSRFREGLGSDGACHGATQEDWSCGGVEFGAFDAATPSGVAASD